MYFMSKKKNEEWGRMADNILAHKYQCKYCGRKEVIRFDKDRVLCSYCHHYIYKNDELEKKYKFKEQMFKEMRENK